GESEHAAIQCVTIQRGLAGIASTDVQDTFLNSSMPTSPLGASTDMNVGIHPSSGATLYAMLKFNLVGVPANATITSANLTVRIGSSTADVVRFHKITSAWAEGTATWSTHSAAWNPTVEATFTAG